MNPVCVTYEKKVSEIIDVKVDGSGNWLTEVKTWVFARLIIRYIFFIFVFVGVPYKHE